MYFSASTLCLRLHRLLRVNMYTFSCQIHVFSFCYDANEIVKSGQGLVISSYVLTTGKHIGGLKLFLIFEFYFIFIQVQEC